MWDVPMRPADFLARAIEPGLALLPPNMGADAARVMLMAIAGQETNWSERRQIPAGQALGYWQFQQDGTVGLMDKLPALTQSVLDTCDLQQSEAWEALQYNDAVACAFARLLLWSHPAPLPAIGDQAGAWAYYRRLWKPGRPDAKRWLSAYPIAVSTVQKPPQS